MWLQPFVGRVVISPAFYCAAEVALPCGRTAVPPALVWVSSARSAPAVTWVVTVHHQYTRRLVPLCGLDGAVCSVAERVLNLPPQKKHDHA